MEAPGGQDVGSILDRAGDFSPRLPRVAVRPRGFDPAARSGPSDAPSRTPTFRRPVHRDPRRRPADASRSTAPATRQVASWTASPVVGRLSVWPDPEPGGARDADFVAGPWTGWPFPRRWRG